MAKREYVVTFEIEAVVQIDDAVFAMVDDEWRENFYPDLKTENDIVEHVAYNLLLGSKLNQLDGWATLKSTDARIKSDDLIHTDVEREY